jgi:transcriptional antiterminator NusG
VIAIKPTASGNITDSSEFNPMTRKSPICRRTSADRPRPKLNFEKNENVRINGGPSASFSGGVGEVSPERNTLRVMVTIFGRSTPVELDFLQVEKI